MAKKKKLIVAVIVISLFAVMSLCGMAVAGQQAMDRSDFHGSEDIPVFVSRALRLFMLPMTLN